jgi:hypothetical protein
MKYLSITNKHIERQTNFVKYTILGIFLIICLLFNGSTLKAESELKEKLIEILSFNVAANDSIFIGDTLLVTVSFKSKLDCEINVGLALSGGFTLVTDTLKDRISYDSIQVVKDSIQYKTYYVQAREMVNSGISFGAAIKLPDINMTLSQHTVLSDATDAFRVRKIGENMSPPFLKNIDKCDDETELYNNEDHECGVYAFSDCSYTGTGGPPTENHHVFIAGSVKYYNWFEPYNKTNKPVREVGALNNVWLFFKKTSGTPTNNLYHPVPYQTLPIEGVHFVRCNPSGGFMFSFDYKIDSLMQSDPSAQWEIILFIGKENAAVNIESDLDHSLITSIDNPDRNAMQIRVYKMPFSIPFDQTNQSFMHIVPVINFNSFASSDEGGIFRHTTLARRFIAERRDILLSSSEIPPQIRYILADNWHYAGLYAGNHIEFFQGIGFANPIIHEYGHYYHDFVNTNGGIVGYGSILEGWATCFATAVMNWENHKYGDRRNFDDDLEAGPYYSEECYQNNIITENRPRFGNVNKINVDPDMSKFSCYLWNVYDSQSDGDFMLSAYEGKNNDDVNGLGKDLFDFLTFYCLNWRNYDDEYGPPDDPEADRTILKPEGFNRLFLEWMVNLDNETKTSIQQIYDFMEFESGQIAKLSSLEMRPPQITMTHVIPPTNILVLLFESNTYDDAIGGGSISWADQSNHLYVANYNFCNRETGVHAYKDFGGVWDLFQQPIPYSSTPALYSKTLNNQIIARYKLSAYKDNAVVDSHSDPNLIIVTPHLAKASIANYDYYDNLIFPMPASNVINVQFLVNESSLLDIEIFDFNLSLVQHLNLTSKAGLNKYTINLNDKLSSGTYYLRINDKNNNLIILDKSFILIK